MGPCVGVRSNAISVSFVESALLLRFERQNLLADQPATIGKLSSSKRRKGVRAVEGGVSGSTYTCMTYLNPQVDKFREQDLKRRLTEFIVQVVRAARSKI